MLSGIRCIKVLFIIVITNCHHFHHFSYFYQWLLKWHPVVVFFVFFLRLIFKRPSLPTDEALPVYEVLVGVLSARHHYELRQAIRETWLGYLRDHPLFRQRFVRHCGGAPTSPLVSLPSFLISRPDSFIRRKNNTGSGQEITDSHTNTFIFT